MKINYLKLAILSLILTFGFSVNAQNSDPSTGVGQGDSAGPSIKLIDNKGTIKYCSLIMVLLQLPLQQMVIKRPLLGN